MDSQVCHHFFSINCVYVFSMQESFVCHKTRWLPSASNISFTKMARFVPWEYLDFESHQFKLQLLTFSWISFLINFWKTAGRQTPVTQSLLIWV